MNVALEELLLYYNFDTWGKEQTSQSYKSHQLGFELQMIVLSGCCQKLNFLGMFSKAHINMLFNCLFQQLCYVNV